MVILLGNCLKDACLAKDGITDVANMIMKGRYGLKCTNSHNNNSKNNVNFI